MYTSPPIGAVLGRSPVQHAPRTPALRQIPPTRGTSRHTIGGCLCHPQAAAMAYGERRIGVIRVEFWVVSCRPTEVQDMAMPRKRG